MVSINKNQGKKNITEIKTFPVPFAMGEIKENLSIINDTHSKEQIVKQALKFHLQGNIQEAAKYYKNFINKGFKDHRVFSNYGSILKDLGNSQEAEILYRKAIKLNPYIAEAHYNLGNVLKAIGNLQEAEISYRKAINIKPDLAEAHYSLGAILSAFGKIDEAILSYNRSLNIKENMPQALVALGNSLLNKGQYVKALNLLKKGDGTISFDLEKGMYIYQ